LAWPTREGNYFLCDTPAPMCNTATTANLDGRDGAYNPQVNYRNNNLAGEDTVPPARLAPRDVVASGTDPATNAITLTTSRIPGAELYCGTPANLDFRFSTPGPITTHTQFDRATPVPSVPPPPRAHHDPADHDDHEHNHHDPTTTSTRWRWMSTTTTTLFAYGSRPESGCQPAAPQKAHLAVATSDFGNPTTTTDNLPCPLRCVGPATR